MPQTRGDTIRGMEDGSLIADLESELQDLVRAVRSTGKPGSLTLKLRITPEGSAQMSTDAQITSTFPKPSRAKEMWYDSEDGQLLRRDPRQLSLEDLAKAREL